MLFTPLGLEEICCVCFIIELSDDVMELSEGSSISSVECQTFDCKVAGSNLTRGAVLCSFARHYIFSA